MSLCPDEKDMVRRFILECECCIDVGWGLPQKNKKVLEKYDAMVKRLAELENQIIISKGQCVLQPWVLGLTFMQQTVLITATRGPDGLHKNHIAKQLLRWLRRCFLYSAFDKSILDDPHDPRGGSFTGPIGIQPEQVVDEYLKCCDEVPHHFHLHLMHAAEILGYKHPDPEIAGFWRWTYCRMANDMHLKPESERRMDRRLGDSLEQWREAEEVIAD